MSNASCSPAGFASGILSIKALPCLLNSRLRKRKLLNIPVTLQTGAEFQKCQIYIRPTDDGRLTKVVTGNSAGLLFESHLSI